MNQGSGACLWTSVPQHYPAPCDRYKHASCAHRGHVYILGGRERCLLRDFWKYNVVCDMWVELPCDSEEAPEELEEHTMVAYQEFLYVFGGMQDSSYSNSKMPLWVFDTVKECWINWKTEGETLQEVTPANRKGHSAVIFGSSMYVYGGYIDIRGSTKEFWKFDFDSRVWSLLSSVEGGPGPRHGHSAMTYQDSMYLYGGLQGLREQKDLWSWSPASQTWSCINFQKIVDLHSKIPKSLVVPSGDLASACCTEWTKFHPITLPVLVDTVKHLKPSSSKDDAMSPCFFKQFRSFQAGWSLCCVV
ncbi:uncharacterized protein si:dkey-3d4.3 isoform X3 [Onychostoma macrolepis]|uniref:uncharacterized protein si:dkey-3d4.3 isoform X3 n=1 Tax=Onychostoma macrolepis TaxID=369639 RepID=UPI00272D7669|nr:uncharacterized protein si:dkey-3d4.3 isoform X3 [Onychostoma macrolepis]